jgi:hypothetical protein
MHYIINHARRCAKQQTKRSVRMTNAEMFKANFPASYAGGIAALKEAGGKLTRANSPRCSRVEHGEIVFPDGSVFTVAFHDGYNYGGRVYAGSDIA